ncbi:MAG: tetratricopeptide repeat protein [Pirellulales bacterium]
MRCRRFLAMPACCAWLCLAALAVARGDEIADYLAKVKESVAAYDKLIAEDPKNAGAYNQRGAAKFKLGQIEESIADFDKFLSLEPDAEPAHWMRGISYYYAGEFEKGRKQFEGYQTYDSNDVENAVWRYLCMAPEVGVEQARDEILKIGDDRRVPMRQVYDLFAGKATADDVLAAVEAGDPPAAKKNERLFYAHLYLGLYAEANGQDEEALAHLQQAQSHRIGHYMWDVARVHGERRAKGERPKAKETIDN